MRIIQISDVHVRNFQRHDEFRKLFDCLYASLREKKPDHIVITGDSAHSKTHVSAELFQILSNFFTSLSEIAPLHLILGNHDLSLANLSRLDVVTPIVNALNNDKIKYYKHSGVYPVDDEHNFVVFSCVDEKNWPNENNIPKDKINIGLYHGMVKGAMYQNGQIVENCEHTVKQFLKITDYLMLGDIHKMQFLDFRQKAAYCGSILQQNFGEGLNKGYLLWDIESSDKHEVDFVKMPNICPYYVIDMPDDLLLTEDLPIQEGARIRIDSRQLISTEKSTLREEISEKYKPIEITFKDDVNAHKQDVKITKGVKIEDLSSSGVQEKLIRKVLEHYELEESMLVRICELNKKYDSEVRQNDNIVRNVQYKFGKMWWNNMLSYGENNTFDFSKRKGLVGIFGKNGSGKSSVAVDIPLYAMLNANTKGVVKNDHLINDKKESCQAVFNVQIGDEIYRFDRSTSVYIKKGKKKGKPVYQGETKLVYTKYDLDGNVILSLDDEQRQATDKEVRRVFGSLEDIRATSIAAQFDLLNFVNKKDTERQKIIGRYFDVDIFEKKRAIAADDCKEIKGELKAYAKRNFTKEKEDIVASVKAFNEEMKDLSEKIVVCDNESKSVEGEIQELTEKIVRVSFDSPEDGRTLVAKIQKKKVGVVNKKNEIDTLRHTKKKLEHKLRFLLGEIDEIDIDKCKKDLKQFKDEAGVIQFSESVACDALICSKNESLEKLKKYPCVVNSDCCMREEIERVEKEKDVVVARQNVLEKQLSCYNVIHKENIVPLENKIADCDSKIAESLEVTRQIQTQEKFLKVQKELFERMSAEVRKLEEQKVLFVKDQQKIEENNEYRQKIDEAKNRHSVLESKRGSFRGAFVRREVERNSLWNEYDKIKADEKSYVELKNEYDAYFYFLEVSGKNGLSRIIVNENLEVINIEIAKILSNKVNFSIELEANESGKIEIYFKSLKSKKRRIELCSGMEKTISAIAIRAALISVTTLPKSNVFVLDEVFASLDPEYFDATRKIIQYLKNLFDAVIIITHIESFRDFVDHSVEVYRDEQGFSRVT